MSLDSDYIRRMQNDEAMRERMDYAIRRGHVNTRRQKQIKEQVSRSFQRDMDKILRKKPWKKGGKKRKTKKRKYKKRKTRNKKRRRKRSKTKKRR
jgi:hypothetical protein